MHKKYYIFVFIALVSKEAISLAALTGATCPTRKEMARRLVTSSAAATTRGAKRLIEALGQAHEEEEIASASITSDVGAAKIAVENCLQQADQKSKEALVNVTIYCEDTERFSIIKSFISNAQVASGFRLEINSIKIDTINTKNAYISINEVKRNGFESEQEKKPAKKKENMYSQYKARL